MNLFDMIGQMVIYSGICCLAIWLDQALSIPYWIMVPLLISASLLIWVAVMGRSDEDEVSFLSTVALAHRALVDRIAELTAESDSFVRERSPGIAPDTPVSRAIRHAGVLLYVDGVQRAQAEDGCGALERAITLIRYADVLTKGESIMERMGALSALDLAVELLERLSAHWDDDTEQMSDLRAALAHIDPSDPVRLFEAIDWELRVVSQGISNRSLPNHMRQPAGDPYHAAQLYETTMRRLREAWISPHRTQAIAAVHIPPEIEDLLPPLSRIATACERTSKSLREAIDGFFD